MAASDASTPHGELRMLMDGKLVEAKSGNVSGFRKVPYGDEGFEQYTETKTYAGSLPPQGS